MDRLCAEYDRLRHPIQTAYVDKLDGSIDADFFVKMSAGRRSEQNRRLRDIGRRQSVD